MYFIYKSLWYLQGTGFMDLPRPLSVCSPTPRSTSSTKSRDLFC